MPEIDLGLTGEATRPELLTVAPRWKEGASVTSLVSYLASKLGVDLRTRLEKVKGLGQVYWLPGVDRMLRICITQAGDDQGRVSMHVTRAQHAAFRCRKEQVFLIGAVARPRIGATKAARRRGRRWMRWCVVTVPYAQVSAYVDETLRTRSRAPLFVKITATASGLRSASLSTGENLEHREGLGVLRSLVGDPETGKSFPPTHAELQAAAVAVVQRQGFTCTVPWNNIEALWETGYLQDRGWRDKPAGHERAVWGEDAPDVVGYPPPGGGRLPEAIMVLEVARKMTAREVRDQLRRRWELMSAACPRRLVRLVVVANAQLGRAVRQELDRSQLEFRERVELWDSLDVMRRFHALSDP